jgi:predicted O-methyltransferase YrrM
MFAVGMITCARPEIGAARAIVELRYAGFDEEVHLFCEPGTPDPGDLPGVTIHRNSTRLGVVGNWARCLAWLIDNTPADHVLVCEDDVAFCRGARRALEEAISSTGSVGFWSLYTPRRDRSLVGHRRGWVVSNRGRDAWGTQAMCFPRQAAAVLLDYPPLREEDQIRGPTDAIVAQCFLDAGLPCYYHNPSLADHLGRVSAVGHNWQEEHVGLGFDREYDPGNDDQRTTPEVPSTDVIQGSVPALTRPRAAVVTVYQDNIHGDVVARHAEVVRRLLPAQCEYLPRRVGHHALGLDDFFRDLWHDAYLVLDVDCVPLYPWVIPWLLEYARAGVLVGAVQRANHLDNGGHLYAGPCAVAFSRDTFERAGRVSFCATERGDVGEELTYACENLGVPVNLLWPTHVEAPRWNLRSGVSFGLGTTFGGVLYHAFEVRKGETVPAFLKKASEVLRGTVPSSHSRPRTWGHDSQSPIGGNPVVPDSQPPKFHESWYSEAELGLLEAAVRLVRPLSGVILEIGCWEGRSTAVIARACAPEELVAVDTWQGNSTESPDHVTVRLARDRDVFATFRENISRLSIGNVTPHREDALDFLRALTAPVKFCHIDAAHDYPSVRETLSRLLPHLVPGGVLFGHDFTTAHAGRGDLGGGVERAVKEVLPYHVSRGNTWWYIHPSLRIEKDTAILG